MNTRMSGRRRLTTLTATAATIAAFVVAAEVRSDPVAAASLTTAPDVRNPGFEAGLTGWTEAGDRAAVKLEAGGHNDSALRLTHYAATRYAVATRQRVGGLHRGWVTVTAWVKSGGALSASTVGLAGCGHSRQTPVPITAQDDQWVRVAVSAYARSSTCTIVFRTRGPGGTWASLDDVAIGYGRVTRDIRGADLSTVPKNEDHGAVYYNAAGQRQRPEKVLAAAGANLGRLKVFVNPADGYNNTAHVVAMAKRIQQSGMQLLIDFHYSDTWADPGAQHPPVAWQNLDAAQLAAAVYAHTHHVLVALRRHGIRPEMVQIGNEINSGILLPLGQTYDVDPTDSVVGAQFDNLAAFLSAGAAAAKKVDPHTRVMLHLTNVNDGVDSLTWWFDQIVSRGVPFDLIGLSFYGYWHGSLHDIQAAITALSTRYHRDVLVAETAYPFTLADDTPAYPNVISEASELVPGYPATPNGQRAYFRDLQNAVAAAPGGRGIGTVYWEPAWTSVAGSGWDPTDPTSGDAWENQAMFDFTGHALPSIADFAPDRRS